MAKDKKASIVRSHLERAEDAMERGDLRLALKAVFKSSVVDENPQKLVPSGWTIGQTDLYRDAANSATEYLERLNTLGGRITELAGIYSQRENAGLVAVVRGKYSNIPDHLESRGFNISSIDHEGIYKMVLSHHPEANDLEMKRRRLTERNDYIDKQVAAILDRNPQLVVCPFFDIMEYGIRPDERLFDPEGVRIYHGINNTNPGQKFLGLGDRVPIIGDNPWQRHGINHVPEEQVVKAVSEQLGVRMPSFTTR